MAENKKNKRNKKSDFTKEDEPKLWTTLCVIIDICLLLHQPLFNIKHLPTQDCVFAMVSNLKTCIIATLLQSCKCHCEYISNHYIKRKAHSTTPSNVSWCKTHTSHTQTLIRG